MTVKELIEKLKNVNLDSKVYISGNPCLLLEDISIDEEGDIILGTAE